MTFGVLRTKTHSFSLMQAVMLNWSYWTLPLVIVWLAGIVDVVMEVTNTTNIETESEGVLDCWDYL